MNIGLQTSCSNCNQQLLCHYSIFIVGHNLSGQESHLQFGETSKFLSRINTLEWRNCVKSGLCTVLENPQRMSTLFVQKLNFKPKRNSTTKYDAIKAKHLTFPIFHLMVHILAYWPRLGTVDILIKVHLGRLKTMPHWR